jgi:hypothetical protein
VLAALAALVGCRTPLGHRRKADRTAERLIADAQKRAVGNLEAVPLEHPGEALRRKLIAEGALPTSGPASLGLRDLPDGPYWKQSLHLPPE